MVLLEVKNLNKKYDDKNVLKDINLKLSSGKIIGLLGKNGAGKTTLIKLINDLLTPTSGEILVKGNKIGIETKKAISYLHITIIAHYQYHVNISLKILWKKITYP